MRLQYPFLLVFLVLSVATFSQPLSGYKLCIDPGHGGHDPANDRQVFLPNGIVYWESESNLETAEHLDTILQKLGAQVLVTRSENTDESDISLSERSALANAFGADYFSSIHTNAHNQSSNYTLVLYKGETDHPAFAEAKRMAGIMGQEIANLLYPDDYYARGDVSFLGYNLGVLRNTNMPASLSEGAFHDVPAEGLRLKNSAYLTNYAWAIAKSFCEYFGTDGFSTGRLGGIVTDVSTGNVINEIKVSTSSGEYTYTGDENYNGFYALSGMKPGTYQVTFSKEGYIDKIVDVTITANTYAEVNVQLQYYNNGYPNVDFVIDNSSVSPGETVNFDASISTDDGEMVSFAWNFGDGEEASGLKTSHVYTTDGTYEVSLKVTDNEGNSSEKKKTVIVKTTIPDPLTLLSVSNSNDGIKVIWNNDDVIPGTGVRIYISSSDDFSDFAVFDDKSQVDASAGELVIDPTIPASGLSLKIAAFNSAGESDFSDTYTYFRVSDATVTKTVLIVDGFDRMGSYSNKIHSFSAYYMQNMRERGTHNVESCANEAVSSGKVKLNDYDIVWWYVGDESTADETFSSAEQEKIKDYLNAGGNLLVTGSEIGWDLVQKGSSSDAAFYANYLKATFAADGGSGRSPASGIAGGYFAGVELPFGLTYPEDYPDEIHASGGSAEIMNYSTGACCGVSYKGSFGSTSDEGRVIYISFPLETVADKAALSNFVSKAFAFFEESSTGIENIAMEDGVVVYPTVFSSNIKLLFKQGFADETILKLMNSAGHVMYQKTLSSVEAGELRSFSATGMPSGIYLLQIQSAKYSEGKKLIKR